MLSYLIRLLRIQTVLRKPPMRRPNLGQRFRLVGDTSPFLVEEVLDHSDDEAELIGAANWWVRRHPCGPATIGERKPSLEESDVLS